MADMNVIELTKLFKDSLEEKCRLGASSVSTTGMHTPFDTLADRDFRPSKLPSTQAMALQMGNTGKASALHSVGPGSGVET